MRIIGVDLHTRQQSVAMLDTDTGEVIEKTLEHEGDEVREFCNTTFCLARYFFKPASPALWPSSSGVSRTQAYTALPP